MLSENDAHIWIADGFYPDPIETMNDWATENYIIPDTRTRLNLALTPYLIEPLFNMSYVSIVREEYDMKGVQLGYTEVFVIIIAGIVDKWPCRVTMYSPNDTLASEFIKLRFDPAFECNPYLEGKVYEGRSQRNKNKSTIGLKLFKGGNFKSAGGKAEANYRSTPAKYVLFDDLDGFPRDVGGTEKRKGQGGPIELGRKRANAQRGKFKIFAQGTPTDEETSLICAEYKNGDQRKYNIPCPHCSTMQIIEWNRVKYVRENGEFEKVLGLECVSCNKIIPESKKYHLMQPESGAKWIAENETRDKTVVSRQISSAYSLLGCTWSDMAKEHIKAGASAKRGNFRPMATFYNTMLGLPWKNELLSTRISHKVLKSQNIEPVEKVPENAVIIVAGIDIQGNRIEVLVVGYGENAERYCIEYKVIGGNTTIAYGLDGSPYNDLEEFLKRTYENHAGSSQPILHSCIDMGFRSVVASPFLVDVTAEGLPITAVFGSSHGKKKKSFLAPEATENKYGYPQRELNVDEGKTLADNQLKMKIIKFINHPSFTPDFYKQLTVENFDEEKQAWVCPDHARNEAFDMLVYSQAAFEVYKGGGNIDWEDFKEWNKNGCTIEDSAGGTVINPGVKV